MDIKKAIWGRRSIRKFKKEKLPDAIIHQILEAGVQAPSSCNQQMFYVIVIDDQDLKKRLEKEAGFKWIERIPTPIFVITDKRFGNEKFSNIQGASGAIQNMLLYAYSIGIGSCWIGGYGDKAIVKKLLNIPQHFHILGCVGLGYPDEKPITPIKRSVNEITFRNRVNLSEKESNDPDDWTYEEIQNLSARAIFAKSPDIGYYHLFHVELKSELEYMSTLLGERNLYIDDISGIYLFKLAEANPKKKFWMVSPAEKVVEWMEEKAKYHNISNITFVYKKDLDIEEKEFDAVLCFEQLNRLPSEQREERMRLCYKKVKEGGRVLVSFLNKNSIYGYLFRKGVARRYGPEISLSWWEIKDIVTKANLKIKERVGFNILPSPRLFFKMGVPGRYTFLNKYLRFMTKYDLWEGSISKGMGAKISTTNIIMAKKEK